MPAYLYATLYITNGAAIVNSAISFVSGHASLPSISGSANSHFNRGSASQNSKFGGFSIRKEPANSRAWSIDFDR